MCDNGLCQFIHLPIDQLAYPPTPAVNQGHWDGNRFKYNKPKKSAIEWTGISQTKKDIQLNNQPANNNWTENQMSQGQQKGFGAISYQTPPIYYQGHQIGYNNLIHPTYSQGTQPTYTPSIPAMFPGTGMMNNQQRTTSQQIIGQHTPGNMMNHISINPRQLAVSMPGQLPTLHQPLQQQAEINPAQQSQSLPQGMHQVQLGQQIQGQDQLNPPGP